MIWTTNTYLQSLGLIYKLFFSFPIFKSLYHIICYCFTTLGM